MKSLTVFLVLPFVVLSVSPAAQAYHPSTNSHFSNRPADAHDTQSIEGWINKLDIARNRIVVMDANGVEKQIWLRPGIISDFKIRDKVSVKTWPGSRQANTITKISG